MHATQPVTRRRVGKVARVQISVRRQAILAAVYRLALDAARQSLGTRDGRGRRRGREGIKS